MSNAQAPFPSNQRVASSQLANSAVSSPYKSRRDRATEAAVKPLLSNDIRFKPASRIHGTIFATEFAKEQLRLEWNDLDHLADEIRGKAAACKGELPWLKLARFGETPSPKGCLRYDANVKWFDGVEIDVDGRGVGIEDAAVKLAGIKCLLYTTASSTPHKPHYRVLCPLSGIYGGPTEALKVVRSRLVARVNGVLGGIVAGESFTLSQSFYFGNIASKPPIVIIVTESKSPIDWMHGLDTTARGRSVRTYENNKVAPEGLEEIELNDAPPELIKAAKRVVLSHHGDGGHKYALACRLIELRHYEHVLSADAVVALLQWYDRGCSEAHAKAKVDHAIRYLKTPRGAVPATFAEEFGL